MQIAHPTGRNKSEQTCFTLLAALIQTLLRSPPRVPLELRLDFVATVQTSDFALSGFDEEGFNTYSAHGDAGLDVLRELLSYSRNLMVDPLDQKRKKKEGEEGEGFTCNI